jgi:fatty acid desaturase
MDTRLMWELRELTLQLSRAPYWAIPRILIDLLLWVGAAVVAARVRTPAIQVLAIAFIGAVPLHDLLVHGHDSTHRLVSRTRMLNEFFLWLTHAWVGISGTAYRAFHLDHHRHTQTDRDPEVRLIRRLSGGHGWGYLLLPLTSHAAVNSYPFVASKSAGIRRRTVRDLAAIGILHAGLAVLVGLRTYLLFCLAPVFTSLAAVVIVRSICEHHGAGPGGRWTDTRTMEVGWLLRALWSNTNYHLEHHLAPRVPFQNLPALRRWILERADGERLLRDRGYVRTAFTLLGEPEHVKARIS